MFFVLCLLFLLDNFQNVESGINYFKNYLKSLLTLHGSLVLCCSNHSFSEEKETLVLSFIASKVRVHHEKFCTKRSVDLQCTL